MNPFRLVNGHLSTVIERGVTMVAPAKTIRPTIETTKPTEEIQEVDDDFLELLDDVGLNFALHTHHPLTHLEYGVDTGAPDDLNERLLCPGTG